jgi:hypothetical protein
MPDSLLIVLEGEIHLYVDGMETIIPAGEKNFKLKPEIEYDITTTEGCKFVILAMPVIKLKT